MTLFLRSTVQCHWETKFTLPAVLRVLITKGCIRPIKRGTIYFLLVTHY